MSDDLHPYFQKAREVELNRSIITKVCLELTDTYSMAQYEKHPDWTWEEDVWQNAMDQADLNDERTARALFLAAHCPADEPEYRDVLLHRYYTEPGLSEAWLQRVAVFDWEMRQKGSI